MKFIRWKAVIPLLVFIIGITILCVFFLDTIIKNTIISIGESIFSAKVEISSLKTKLKNMSIEINGIQVADKSDPWKNLFEIDRVKFGMKFIPLLSKKVIIDEMSTEGIKWSTKRKTYGGLPPKKLKKIEKKKRKEEETFTSKLMAKLQEKAKKEIETLPAVKNAKELEKELKSIDINKLISETEFESKKLIEALQTESSQKYQNYKNEIQNLNVDEQIKIVKSLIDDVSSIKIEKLEDIKTAQEKISQLNEKKKSLEASLEKLKKLKTSIESDFIETKEISKKIEQAIENDYKNILNKVKLPELSKGNISRALFGDLWINRVNNVIYYIHLARKYFPPRKKEEKKTLRQRAKGIDVVFHKENVLPELWIKKISISGTTGGEGKDNENAITLSGVVNDISSDPALINKPTTLKIEGRKLTRQYLIEGIFDHIKETPIDTISLNIKGPGIKEFKMPESQFIPKIEDGTLNIQSSFTLKGDEIDCRMNLSIEKIKFSKTGSSKEGEFQDELKKIIDEIFQSIDRIFLTAKLYGKMDSLTTELDSNLDDLITNKLKSIYGQKIQEFRAKIKSEIDKNITQPKEKFLKEYSEKKEELEKIFSSKKASIDEQKSQIEKKQEETKDKINKATEKEKKKKEEELLKKLLK